VPYTPEELIPVVNAVLAGGVGDIEDWRWKDGTTATYEEFRDILALVLYTQRTRRCHRFGVQRRAYRLLRSLLSADQRRDLSRLGYFRVTARSGQTYRLDPRRGHAERVERHGSRWFSRKSYCLHDEEDAGKMPPADVTVGHLLMLVADESVFLATANETARDDQLWNSAYLRRMRQGRLERQAQQVG
jgi:hypothetical protein